MAEDMMERARDGINAALIDLGLAELNGVAAGALARGALLAAIDPEDEALVESIARSISLCGRDWDTPFDFDDAPDYAKDMQRDIARAAILTLKQLAQGVSE